MSQHDLFGLAALAVACLLAAAMMLPSWYRRRTRPPLVAGAFVLLLALVASLLVAIGVTYSLVVGPTFIIALLVILYTARYDRRVATTPPGAGPSRRS